MNPDESEDGQTLAGIHNRLMDLELALDDVNELHGGLVALHGQDLIVGRELNTVNLPLVVHPEGFRVGVCETLNGDTSGTSGPDGEYLEGLRKVRLIN